VLLRAFRTESAAWLNDARDRSQSHRVAQGVSDKKAASSPKGIIPSQSHRVAQGVSDILTVAPELAPLFVAIPPCCSGRFGRAQEIALMRALKSSQSHRVAQGVSDSSSSNSFPFKELRRSFP